MNSRSFLPLLPLFCSCLLAGAAPVDDAKALVAEGKWDEAISKLEAALRAGGAEKNTVALELIRTQVSAGRFISAQKSADRFLRESPNDPHRSEIQLLNARLIEASGDLAEAVSIYRTIAEANPPVAERAEALALAVQASTLLGNESLKERCMDEFVEAFPQDPRSREFLLRVYRARASQQDHRIAAAVAHRFKAAYPNDPAGAAFHEFSHLALANDPAAAITTFQEERKLPTFSLNASVMGSALGVMRSHKSGFDLIEPLAAEFATLTGDPGFQVQAVEILSELDAEYAEKAVKLGRQLLQKYPNSAHQARLRLAIASGLIRLKNNEEAEKELVTLLESEPGNAAAWEKHQSVTTTLKRPEAHTALLQKARASLASQKNVTLAATTRAHIAYRLANHAFLLKDYSAALEHVQAFLTTEGLASSGAILQIGADSCFAGLAAAVKASEDAATALQAAKVKNATAEGDLKKASAADKPAVEKTLAAAKTALATATTNVETAQKALDQIQTTAAARMDSLLPALEKYLARTVHWNPMASTLDAPFKAHFAHKVVSAESRKFNQFLQRLQKADNRSTPGFQTARAAGQWAQAARLGETLLPKLLEAGGAIGLEGGADVIAALYNGGQTEKVIAASRLYFAKYPGATGPLPHLGQAADQLGAPKNADTMALIKEVLEKAGGTVLPADTLVQVRRNLFSIAESNRQPSEMEAQLKKIEALTPGSVALTTLKQRLGVTLAATGSLEQGKQKLLAALKESEPTAQQAPVLASIATSFPDAADWALPHLDAYLAHPKRGPQQTSLRILRAALLANDSKDLSAATKDIQLAAERKVDLVWPLGIQPTKWSEILLKPALTAKPEEVTAEQLKLLSDSCDILGNPSPLLLSLVSRNAHLGDNFAAARRLHQVLLISNANDSAQLNGFVTLAQQLATLKKPELGGIALRSSINRFTGVDPKVRSQASQVLFSLSSKHGFAAVEIDPKLEWAPMLKAALNFRMGDVTAAWKAYEDNEALFAKHEDKLPADFLRWISDRLLQREDETSRDTAEKILRRWNIANENSTAVPEDEKAKTQLQLANLYFKTLRYDLARSEATSLMNRFPNTAEAIDAQFKIGECFLNQKMFIDAGKIFEKMAKAKDKLSASRGEFLLGVLAQQRGDSDDAKQRFRNVMDLAPSSDVADAILYKLSELYGQENRFRDELLLLRSIGLIGSNSKLWHTPGMPLNIVIQDADLGISRGQSFVPVIVTTSSGDKELVRLESGSAGKGFFRAELPTELGDSTPGDHILQVTGSDIITYDYPDDFKSQFTNIAPPQSNIRIASDAEFRISATEIKDEQEVSFEERLRLQRQLAGKQAGLQFRQEFRNGNDLKPGNNLYLQLKDADRDVSKEADTIKVLVTALSGSSVTATLTETGPHTGIFRGSLSTLEISAEIFASDKSINSEAVRAIDRNPKTAWEGLNDGRGPKFIAIDLKESKQLGSLKWANDGVTKGKVPTEYAVQVSDNLTDWETVAATKGFSKTSTELQARVDGKTEGNAASALLNLKGAKGRYVRLFIEKFQGTSPRIAEIEVTDDTGKVLIPADREASAATTADNNNALRLTPSDRITATYDDETNIATLGKPRSLTQQLRATYYNGKIDFIAYEFKEIKGQAVPDKLVKQVRRADAGQRVIVRITDYDADVSEQRDKVQFTIKTADGPQPLEATETEAFTGVFTKEIDIWSPERPNGIKLEAGKPIVVNYMDQQNTDPGAPMVRTASLDLAVADEAKVAFVLTSVQPGRAQSPTVQYLSSFEAPSPAPAIKPVAFTVPLTFEIIAPGAAKDSFSEVKAVLTTTGGSTAEVICPLAEIPGSKRVKREGLDDALEEGRFIGQIYMNLGDKESPNTIVLEPGNIQPTVARRNPAVAQEQQLANVVPVLNLNGQDIIKVTYMLGDKEISDQARLSLPPTVEFTDNSYKKSVPDLHIGDKVFISVKDLTADASSERDFVDITLTSTRGESFQTRLQETLSHSGEFTGSFTLSANEKPVAGDDKMEAWFGDELKLNYSAKPDPSSKVEISIPVVKGTDGNLLVFEKKFASEQVAIESQFRMAEAFFELFKNYRTLKQQTQATNALNEGMQILKELSRDYPSKQYEARTDYLLGQFSQELKKFDEAIGFYKRIVQNHSESTLAPESQYKLGQCYEEKNDMDAASAEYVTLAYTWPDSPLVANVVVRIAEYFYNKKEFPTAAEVSKKFVDRFPQHEWAERMLFRAAQCRFKADQFLKAADEFDLLVENYPRSSFRPDAIFWAGESLRSGANLQAAYRRYKRVTWDYPESEAAKFARGKLVTPEMVNIADRDAQPQ